MNGKETFDAMRRINPKIKVIFTSGYAADYAGNPFILEEEVPFLPKPYGLLSLAQTVREVLDKEAV